MAGGNQNQKPTLPWINFFFNLSFNLHHQNPKRKLIFWPNQNKVLQVFCKPVGKVCVTELNPHKGFKKFKTLAPRGLFPAAGVWQLIPCLVESLITPHSQTRAWISAGISQPRVSHPRCVPWASVRKLCWWVSKKHIVIRHVEQVTGLCRWQDVSQRWSKQWQKPDGLVLVYVR